MFFYSFEPEKLPKITCYQQEQATSVALGCLFIVTESCTPHKLINVDAIRASGTPSCEDNEPLPWPIRSNSDIRRLDTTWLRDTIIAYKSVSLCSFELGLSDTESLSLWVSDATHYIVSSETAISSVDKLTFVRDAQFFSWRRNVIIEAASSMSTPPKCLLDV